MAWFGPAEFLRCRGPRGPDPTAQSPAGRAAVRVGCPEGGCSPAGLATLQGGTSSVRRSLVSLAVLGLSLAAVPGFAQSSPNPFQFSTPVIAHGPFLLSEVYPVLPLGYGIPSPGVSGVNPGLIS